MDRLGDTEGALESFRAALAADGAHAPTIAALSALMSAGRVAGQGGRDPRAGVPVEARLAKRDRGARGAARARGRPRRAQGAARAARRLLRDAPRGPRGRARGLRAPVPRRSDRRGRVGHDGAPRGASSRSPHVSPRSSTSRLDARGVDDPQMAKLALHAGPLHDEKTGDLARAAKDYGLALGFDSTDRTPSRRSRRST